MSLDNDLAAALPDPPLPRPDRRKQAIEQALQRFDGREQAAEIPAAPARTPVRAFLGRPQMAAFATVLLVALVSTPAWLPYLDRHGPSGTEGRAAPTEHYGTSGAKPVSAVPGSASAEPIRPAGRPDRPDTASPAQVADAAQDAPAPPVIADLAPERLARADQLSREPAPSPVVSAPPMKAAGAVSSRGVAAPPPPPAQLAEASDKDDNIIVTGSRVQRSSNYMNTPISPGFVKSPPNDDAWNACTVLDARRNLRACRDLVDPSRPGPAGRAAGHLADGLTAAWGGNLDNAIKAFDRAIAAAPHSSLAYLNRGLARQAKGERDRAIADFTLAIRWDPDSASAYYHRSLVLREQGKTAPADADAKRARQLDPRNAGVLKTPEDR